MNPDYKNDPAPRPTSPDPTSPEEEREMEIALEAAPKSCPPRREKNRIEARSWRGDGVCGDRHTD